LELKAAIKVAKAAGKRRVPAGDNLYVEIEPMAWRFRYTFEGRQKEISFGSLDDVSLADARKLITKAGAMLPCEDPRRLGVQRRRDVPAPPSVPVVHPFKQIADEWFQPRIRANSRERVWQRRFERHVYPSIGALDVRDVTAPVLREAMLRIERPYLRGKILAKLSRVMRHAIASGKAENDPSNIIRDGLGPSPKVVHHRSLKVSDLGHLVAATEEGPGLRITRLALKFVILSACRTGEVRYAVWSEIEAIDGFSPLWRIPATRMKAGKAHIVPLSTQAVAVLKEARALYPKGEIIFPSPASASGFLSENALLGLVGKLGFGDSTTVHGLRTTFSTCANEHGWPGDHVEMQLAHVEKNSVRAAYLRAEWLEPRRKLMQWWGDFVEDAFNKTISERSR
jgi:integrase